MNTPLQNNPAPNGFPPPKDLEITRDAHGHTSFTCKYNASKKVAAIISMLFFLGLNGVLYTLFFRQLLEKEHANAFVFLPFALVSTFLALLFFYGFFGKERITIKENHLEQFTGLGPLGTTKSFRFSDHDTIQLIRCTYGDERGFLELTGSSGEFKLGENVPLPALRYIRQELSRATCLAPRPDIMDTLFYYTIICPGCSQRMGIQDLHVSRETILCPHCGRESAYSALPAPRQELLLSWIKGIKQLPSPEGVERYEVNIRRYYLGFQALFFSLLWYGLLSAFILLVYTKSKTVSLPLLLVFCPFLLAGLIPLLTGLYSFWGKDIFTFGHGQGSRSYGIGFLKRREQFTYSSEDTITHDCMGGKKHYITLRNRKGKKTQIGGFVPSDAVEFIKERLKRSQQQLRNTPPDRLS